MTISDRTGTAVGGAFWSDALALAILDAIGRHALRELFEGELRNVAPTSPSDLRKELLVRSRRSRTCRRRLMQRWRLHHESVVLAVDFVETFGSSDQYQALLNRFGPADVLLSMITADEEGWELARWFVECLPYEQPRNVLRTVMAQWCEPTGQEALARDIRIVIFGGHPRDESRLARQLFRDNRFAVQWRAEEKRGWEVDRVVRGALQSADAALIITSRISHEFMRSVKQHAQRYGIPFRCVIKSTPKQLSAALAQLFPQVSTGMG